MTFTFYIVDESQLPTDDYPISTLQSVVTAIREHGGRWSVVDSDIESFADAFKTLDGFVNGRILPQLAFSGSPNLILTSDPGSWRLGYFETSLVPHLDGAFRQLSTEINDAMQPKNDMTLHVFQSFLSSLEAASERDYAVAILHG